MSIITVVLLTPLFVIWAVGVVGMLRREDLGTSARTVWAFVMVLLPPLSILYVWSRPPRLIWRATADWRDSLLDRLERTSSDPVLEPTDTEPVLSDRDLADRVVSALAAGRAAP